MKNRFLSVKKLSKIIADMKHEILHLSTALAMWDQVYGVMKERHRLLEKEIAALRKTNEDLERENADLNNDILESERVIRKGCKATGYNL